MRIFRGPGTSSMLIAVVFARPWLINQLLRALTAHDAQRDVLRLGPVHGRPRREGCAACSPLVGRPLSGERHRGAGRSCRASEGEARFELAFARAP